METLHNYLKEQKHQKLLDEILDLKLKHPLSEKDKLRIQKLQQQLSKITN